ncbi:collagen alpha-1(XII) chain-like [Dendronephthya gigantea]|uniref:collagen alpha-1(XII) chain-like n=1 Tax=Dendronephthya gigantea TaxID=151771 RepID=UPI00106A29A2|nr:collagen alpha-1(XII) chain-like [Dendronephthya gigantea]
MKSVVVLSLLLFCVLPKNSEQTFWRFAETTPAPTTTLPSDSNAPIYQKLQIIPPPQKTAETVLENFFDFYPVAGNRNRRSVVLEDIVFVLDGSGSVPECEFRQGLKAFTQAIEMCETPRGGKIYSCRHAAVTFSSLAKVDFSFLSSAQASQRIGSIPYPGGSTNTQAGLAFAKDLLLKGSRRFSKLKVLLITDGQSNVNKSMTVPKAQELKKMGVQISVVAVSDLDTDAIKEMAHVASSPAIKHVFRVQSVGKLAYVFDMAFEKLKSGQYKVKPYRSPC